MKKQVRFAPHPIVHNMVVWRFAYNDSRKKYWEILAADRHRFAQKILNIGQIITPLLQNKLKCGVNNIKYK